MAQIPTYFLSVMWLPPAGRMPRRRNASEKEIEALTASRASDSEYRGPPLDTNICSPKYRTD
jgi:hypothetical protein